MRSNISDDLVNKLIPILETYTSDPVIGRFYNSLCERREKIAFEQFRSVIGTKPELQPRPIAKPGDENISDEEKRAVILAELGIDIPSKTEPSAGDV